MVDVIDSITGEQKLVKFIQMSLDKNGKLTFGRTDSWLASNWVQENGSVDPGGAQDAQIIQIEVEAGEILEIMNLSLSSESGSKPVGIGHSTAGTFADPFSGMAGATLLWAGMAAAAGSTISNNGSKPLLIIDNSAGSASLYVYIFAYDAYLDVVQVNTEKVGASYSGILYDATE
jgi:hypothetical protein